MCLPNLLRFYVSNQNGCKTLIREFIPRRHKPKYRVGVFSSEGDEIVYSHYNLTFGRYLTETAGRRFDPPIEFDLVPVTLEYLLEHAELEDVDSVSDLPEEPVESSESLDSQPQTQWVAVLLGPAFPVPAFGIAAKKKRTLTPDGAQEKEASA